MLKRKFGIWLLRRSCDHIIILKYEDIDSHCIFGLKISCHCCLHYGTSSTPLCFHRGRITLGPFSSNWSQNGPNVSPIHHVNQYIVLMNKKRHIFGSGSDWKWYLIVFNSSDGLHHCGPPKIEEWANVCYFLDSYHLEGHTLMHLWLVVLKGCPTQISEFDVSADSNCWN